MQNTETHTVTWFRKFTGIIKRTGPSSRLFKQKIISGHSLLEAASNSGRNPRGQTSHSCEVSFWSMQMPESHPCFPTHDPVDATNNLIGTPSWNCVELFLWYVTTTVSWYSGSLDIQTVRRRSFSRAHYGNMHLIVQNNGFAPAWNPSPSHPEVVPALALPER